MQRTVLPLVPEHIAISSLLHDRAKHKIDVCALMTERHPLPVIGVCVPDIIGLLQIGYRIFSTGIRIEGLFAGIRMAPVKLIVCFQLGLPGQRFGIAKRRAVIVTMPLLIIHLVQRISPPAIKELIDGIQPSAACIMIQSPGKIG